MALPEKRRRQNGAEKIRQSDNAIVMALMCIWAGLARMWIRLSQWRSTCCFGHYHLYLQSQPTPCCSPVNLLTPTWHSYPVSSHILGSSYKAQPISSAHPFFAYLGNAMMMQVEDTGHCHLYGTKDCHYFQLSIIYARASYSWGGKTMSHIPPLRNHTLSISSRCSLKAHGEYFSSS